MLATGYDDYLAACSRYRTAAKDTCERAVAAVRPVLAKGLLRDPDAAPPLVCVWVYGRFPADLVQATIDPPGWENSDKVRRCLAKAMLAILDAGPTLDYVPSDCPDVWRVQAELITGEDDATARHMYPVTAALPSGLRPLLDPRSLDPRMLETLAAREPETFRAVAMYRLGGLFDVGRADKIVRRPRTHPHPGFTEVMAHVVWSARYPLHNRLDESGALDPSQFPPEIASEMADRFEMWVQEETPSAGIRPTSAFAPPEGKRNAFHTVANMFESLRREWIASDRAMPSWFSAGLQATSGFQEVFRHEARAAVAATRHKLEHDADCVPFILPHCDPLLRDAVLRMQTLTNLDTVQPDNEGEPSERWRQTWPATGLDAELTELIHKLRAAGEASVVSARGGAAVVGSGGGASGREDVKPPGEPAGADVGLDDPDVALLEFLNRTPGLRRKVSDVLPDRGPQDRKAVGKRLRKLADRTPPLVDYPKDEKGNRPRNGVMILPAGVARLKQETAPKPR